MRSVLLLLCAMATMPVSSSDASHRRSFWSKTAMIFHVELNGSYEPMRCPGGRIVFSFDRDRYIFRDKQGGMLLEWMGTASTPELLEMGCSSDDTLVFVNASDGGAVGTWKTYVFGRSGLVYREINVERLVERISALRTDCEAKNVGAVAWVGSGRELLLLEQVPNSSGCSGMGRMVGYVIDVDSLTVKERLSAKQVRYRFHDRLGPFGMAAVD